MEGVGSRGEVVRRVSRHDHGWDGTAVGGTKHFLKPKRVGVQLASVGDKATTLILCDAFIESLYAQGMICTTRREDVLPLGTSLFSTFRAVSSYRPLPCCGCEWSRGSFTCPNFPGSSIAVSNACVKGTCVTISGEQLKMQTSPHLLPYLGMQMFMLPDHRYLATKVSLQDRLAVPAGHVILRTGNTQNATSNCGGTAVSTFLCDANAAVPLSLLFLRPFVPPGP